LFIFCFLLLTI